MSDVLPLALVFALATLGALVNGPTRARRALGYAIALGSLVAPWLVPQEHLVWRSCLAIMVFGGFMRATDLLSGKWGAGERVMHALSIVDSRKVTRVSPRVELGALA